MPTFAELQNDSDTPSLVRKIQRAVAFLCPLSVDLPEVLTDASGALVALPAGFLPVGIVTPDGYRFGSDVEKEDIDALGYSTPVRSDITKVARSVTFTALETGKRHLLELKHGVDLSTVTQAAGGEVVFDEPEMPLGQEYRLLVIGNDGAAAANWVLGKGYPRVKLANVGEEAWSKDGALTQEITLDVYTDDDLGTPVRHYMGGTGAAAASDVLGFTAAP